MVLYIDVHPTRVEHLEKIKESGNLESKEHGVSTIEMFYNPQAQKLYYVLEAPDEQAVQNMHKRLGLQCSSIIHVDKINTNSGDNTARLAAIGELAARLAHDLRNPLSIIKNTVEIMETKQKFRIEERIVYYNRLHRAIDRISHQIEDVLDFVRPLALSCNKHMINEIIAAAIEKITIPDTVKINLPKNFVYFICDFTKLEIVFTNLIINAIQAMNNSGQVDIQITERDKDVLITFSDTGQGIPNDVIPKIFEPLFTTKQTGTGLGLASCKKIVEQHYGTIEVSSEAGRGTTFTISLPKQSIVVRQDNEPQKDSIVIS